MKAAIYARVSKANGDQHPDNQIDVLTEWARRLGHDRVQVYVDRQSTQYLEGSEIDYLDTLMGAGFTVNNPNAVSACGCGSSFRTSDSAGAPGACHH